MHINQGVKMDKKEIIRALREGAQSVSAGIADGAIGTNVDLLSGALRYAGVPVPENAMGGKQWLRENGYVKDNPGLGNDIARAMGEAPMALLQVPQSAKHIVNQAKDMIAR